MLGLDLGSVEYVETSSCVSIVFPNTDQITREPIFFSLHMQNITRRDLHRHHHCVFGEFSHPLRFIFVNNMSARLTRQFVHEIIGCANACIQIIILSASELHIINCTRCHHTVDDRHRHLSLICMHSDMQSKSSACDAIMDRIYAHQILCSLV